MCDTQEHIKIGEKAFSWSLGILRSGQAGTGYAFVNHLLTMKYERYNQDSSDSMGGRPKVFFLTNGAQASYGDILALAGDFYPEYAKIFADREQVQRGHELLLDSDAVAFDNDKRPHADEINGVLRAYHMKLAGKKWELHDEEEARPGITHLNINKLDHLQGHDLGRVLRLALNNPDHFGIEAIAKWERYHKLACEIAAEGRRYYESGELARYEAASGDGLPLKRGLPCEPALEAYRGKKEYPLINSLWLALRYNAFGDHFLSDLFSAGHMRTPRLDLIQQFPPDEFCANFGWPGNKVFGAAKIDLASVISGIHHDEDGRFGLWAEMLLGKVRVGSLGKDCPAIDADQFFARGDGHYLNPVNVDARALCYRAVALSIRDVIFASLIGKDPREAPHYWTPFGGKQQSRWAALRLVPRPLDPDPGWQYDFYLKRRSGGRYINHQPLVMPESGLADRWKQLREYITAPDNAIPSRTLEKNQLRRTRFKYHHIPYLGTDLGDPQEGPGNSAVYFDLKEWLTMKTNALEHIGQDEWAGFELGRLVGTYKSYKGLDAEPHDNSAFNE